MDTMYIAMTALPYKIQLVSNLDTFGNFHAWYCILLVIGKEIFAGGG